MRIWRYLGCLLSLLLAVLVYASSSGPVVTKHAMVVTAQHLATRVGVNILKRGGNAVDAAVAIGYALAVVHPCCGNLGGGGFMMIHLAKPKPGQAKNIFINFREKAPSGISPKLFIDRRTGQLKNKFKTKHVGAVRPEGYLAAGIPGTVMGLNTALKKFGTMSLRQVMSPAINLAEHGFILKPGDVKILDSTTRAFLRQPNVAKIFLNHGKPYKTGQRLIQINLANTLSQIEHYGTRVFYRGDIAKQIVMASKKHGGLFTMKDFANYTVTISKPIECNYRGYQVYTAAPPSGGGVLLCEMLNILSGYPLNKLGYHAAQTVHYQLEAMRYAYADRNQFLGDPAYVVNPVKRLLSEKYAASIRKKIKQNQATLSNSIGIVAIQHEGHDTTSYSIVDSTGNAVAVTYTINNYFGAKVIPGKLGFFLNDEMDDFTISPSIPNVYGLIQGMPNIMAPGKRPLSSMTPTIITKNNQLFMLLGTPGGSWIPTQIIQVIQNVIDFGMNIHQAVSAARFHMQWLPDMVYLEPYTLSTLTMIKLKRMGYRFKLGTEWGSLYWGRVMAILKNPKTGNLEGVSDNRITAGLALGY